MGPGNEKVPLSSLVQNLFWVEEEGPKGISPKALGFSCVSTFPRTPRSGLGALFQLLPSYILGVGL